MFVIGRRGDMFTRLYDFDISGHDPVFFRYSYEDQRGKGDGAPIQLPAEGWVEQPKIPGTITSAISIHKVGRDAVHRILRVEGERRGRTGYWERDVADPPAAGWSFHATGEPLTGRRLANPPSDGSARGLGRGEDTLYRMRGEGTRGELVDFNVYCSPAELRLRDGDGERRLLLHHVDGLRQKVRGRGLDHEPRIQYGALEEPGGEFTEVTVEATRSEVFVKELGWRFQRVEGCLPRRGSVERRGLDRIRVGLPRRRLRARMPDPRRRAAAAWRWCVGGGGRVAAAFAGGRVGLAATTAPRWAIGGVHPGSDAAAVRRAFPRAVLVRRGVVRSGPRGRVVFGKRRGAVRWIGVAAPRTLDRPALLRRLLGRAGLVADRR